MSGLMSGFDRYPYRGAMAMETAMPPHDVVAVNLVVPVILFVKLRKFRSVQVLEVALPRGLGLPQDSACVGLPSRVVVVPVIAVVGAVFVLDCRRRVTESLTEQRQG